MVLSQSILVDLFLPVGILLAKATEATHVKTYCTFGSEVIGHGPELITRHDIHVGWNGIDRHGTIVFNLHWFTCCSFFGCNQDDTVGSPGTIDSGCRSIFQYSESFDVVGVNRCQWIRQAGNTGVADRKSVNNDQWIVAGRHGRTSANTDSCTTSGSTT